MVMVKKKKRGTGRKGLQHLHDIIFYLKKNTCNPTQTKITHDIIHDMFV